MESFGQTGSSVYFLCTAGIIMELSCVEGISQTPHFPSVLTQCFTEHLLFTQRLD